MKIDYDQLYNSLCDVIGDNVDMDHMVLSATLCWDGTAVRVGVGENVFVFSLLDYELLSFEGFDVL